MIRTTAFLRVTLFILTSSLFSFNGKAQVIQEVQHSFNFYTQNALQEKIFVHTDKDTYLPGEEVWFKVYGVDGNDHKALDLSKVVYIEIIDHHQNPVIQTKVNLKNGIGDGSIYIPVSIANGNYQFRAYTSWMKNFSPDFYFEKKITLINPLRTPDAPVHETSAAFSLQFFPEGGNLLSGITGKMAFKAVDQHGKGLAVTGAVVDQRNDTVARFKSLKFGMGSFPFTPAPNAVYKAVVFSGSMHLTKELPEVNNKGYVMKLADNGSGQLAITVNSSGLPDGAIYLFAHTRQTVKAAMTANMVGGIAHFTLYKNTLGEGISALTLFNAAKQPVCERLYFKRPVQKMFIDARADQQQYSLRKKVNVSVEAKGESGKAVNAELSMAVYRIDSLQGLDQSNIYNYLWLSSELKGSIESPDYYFKAVNAETDEALDNLMLTQGWRRFEWNTVLQNKRPSFAFLPEYNGHIIAAKIVNTATHAPAKNILTYLGIPGKRVQLYTSGSDSLGNLSYYTKDFYGPNEIIIQANPVVDSTYRIEVLTPFSDQYSKTRLPDFKIYPNTLTAIQEHSVGAQVLNIYSGSYLKRFYTPVVDSSAFYGKPTSIYKLDDFTRFTTMEEDLREYVKEDNIVKSKGRFHIKVLTDRGFLDGGDPLVLLDGVPVFDINKVFTIDPLKVRKLEVMAAIYYYGSAKEQGIFSFTTYKGDLGGIELDPHAAVLDYEGMQLHREFYTPVYDTEVQASSRIPDFRNLLYWAPSIGKGPISFYTSDRAGKYAGVVQGITSDGDAGCQYFTFEVK